MQVTEFQTMKQAAPGKNFAERRSEFNEKYKGWIAEQTALIEKYGVFGEEFRTW